MKLCYLTLVVLGRGFVKNKAYNLLKVHQLYFVSLIIKYVAMK